MSTVRLNLAGRLVGVRVVDGQAQGQPGQQAPPPAPEASAELVRQARQLAQATAAAGKAAQQLVELQQQLAGEAEQQVVTLALEIAGKVLMQELQAGRYEIDPIVREALDRLPGRRSVVVRLNPADLDRSGLAAVGMQNVTFQADPGIAPGDCVATSEEGSVESRVEDHLRELSSALQEGN